MMKKQHSKTESPNLKGHKNDLPSFRPLMMVTITTETALDTS